MVGISVSNVTLTGNSVPETTLLKRLNFDNERATSAGNPVLVDIWPDSAECENVAVGRPEKAIEYKTEPGVMEVTLESCQKFGPAVFIAQNPECT